MYGPVIFWLIVTLATASASENVSTEDNDTPLPITRFPPLVKDYLLELNITESENRYDFIVLIVYGGQFYVYGIYFRPRFVLTAYKKLTEFKQLDLMVVGWNNSHLEDQDQVRKVVNVETYPNDESCDFDLSLIEIEHPFKGNTLFWHVKLMTKKKPPPGTQCFIIHLNADRFELAAAFVRDWKKHNCSQAMYKSSCDESTVLCLSSMVSFEVDITGSPIMCNNKIAGAVPGFFIHDLMSIQYLPSYKDWIDQYSDKLLHRPLLMSYGLNVCKSSHVLTGLIIIFRLVYANTIF